MSGKSIKLMSLARSLNVGIQSLVDHLNKNGANIDSKDPNTKIGHEEFDLLIAEFAKDKSPEEIEKLRGKKAPAKNKPIAPPTPEIKEEKITKPKKEVVQTTVPENLKPKVIIKGHIDDFKSKEGKETSQKPIEQPKTTEDSSDKKEPQIKVAPVQAQAPQEPKKENPKVEPKPLQPQQEEKAKDDEPVKKDEPKVETKPNPNIPQKKTETPEPKLEEVAAHQLSAPQEEEKTEVISAGQTAKELMEGSGPKILGKIDLGAINSTMRPKKKTKEERARERNKQLAEGGDANGKKKRKRINNKAVDVKQEGEKVAENDRKNHKKNKNNNATKANNNNKQGGSSNFNRSAHDGERPSSHKKDKNKKKHQQKPMPELTDEEVQKQVKETLARLTNKEKQFANSARYRREKREAAREAAAMREAAADAESRVLKLTEFVTVSDLANMMDVPATQVIGTCMSIGMMVSINQRLDAETINIVADEFGFKTDFVSADLVETISGVEEEIDAPEDLQSRPPIVTVMGHVDHGKTSLLDNIRKANVIAGEAGGITQHIGAYSVTLPNGRKITFLDTPGHEAFTAMRARGAKVTDIAIIIVAADDDVMPQTKEAINHAAAAGVPMVFAINKIDKPGANPEKIKEQLAAMNYLVEDWGGKYQSQDISAKQGVGIEELLEKVLLEADLLDLKANPNRRANGSIIESSLDKGRGYVSTVLVENGTLKMGDIVLAGTSQGRVKAMFNERNKRITEAGPSEPVLILGLNGAPTAGDKFNVLESEQEAKSIANKREQLQREQANRTRKGLTLEELARRRALGNFQELNIIVKGDVDGSVEALSDSLIRLSTEEIQVNVIHKGVGQISESDVVLGEASDAIIVGFQVRPSVAARRLAERQGVEIRTYSIIYDTIEDVKSAMEGMLSPEIKEEVTGTLEVQQVFKISKVGTIAGCMVQEGKIRRTSKVRLIRDGIVLYSGELGSLKRFKDDAKEVVAGLECGLNITNYNDLKEGDLIEAYDEIEIKKTL